VPVDTLSWLSAAAAALAAWALIWRGLGREPWLDELATLEVVDRPGGISRLLSDVHPPAFTLVAAGVAAGRRDWRRLRLPGALATALAAAATALAAAPAGPLAAAGAATLAALSSHALRTGSDFRPYGFALLGGALGTLGTVHCDAPAGWIGLAAGALLALGSHFAAAALLPGWLLLAEGGARPLHTLFSLAPGLTLFGLSLGLQRASLRGAAAAWWMPALTPRRFFRQLAVAGGGGAPGAAATLGVVALAGVGGAEALGARLGLAALLGCVTLIGVSWALRPVVWPRTLLLLQPFAVAAAGVGVAVLARRAGLVVAALALAAVALAASRRALAAAWTRGDEPWTAALDGARVAEPGTALAACPPWVALAVAPALRVPLALDRGAGETLAGQLAGVRRLVLVVRVDLRLLGREPGFDGFFAALAGSPLERLRLTLVESPDREILVELRALARALHASATAAWGGPIEARSGPGFEVLELARPGTVP